MCMDKNVVRYKGISEAVLTSMRGGIITQVIIIPPKHFTLWYFQKKSAATMTENREALKEINKHKHKIRDFFLNLKAKKKKKIYLLHLLTSMNDSKEHFELISIDYPGVVINKEKMIESLGGPLILSQVLSESSRKLQLWLNPEDRLRKPISATECAANTLLVKIKVKKKDRKILAYEVIGQAKMNYCFLSLCDFQYLPIESGVNIYDKICPSKLDRDWIKGDGPSILMPLQLSRTENVQPYHFSSKASVEDSQIITSARPKRFGMAIFVGFEDKHAPKSPKQSPDQIFRQNPQYKVMLETIAELLKERPVISRSVATCKTGLSEYVLKELMPYVAYHFHNGPWRTMWVRFGYDPREDPVARIYQTLDYRVKSEVETMVAPKRKSKSTICPNPRAAAKVEGNISDSYKLLPGRLPPGRQYFYQYCDIELPEVEELLATAGARAECHPADGWWPEGTSCSCRAIIRTYMADAFQQLQAKAQQSDSIDDYLASSDGDGDDADTDSDDAVFLSTHNK